MMTVFTTQALSAIAVIVAASALGACQNRRALLSAPVRPSTSRRPKSDRKSKEPAKDYRMPLKANEFGRGR